MSSLRDKTCGELRSADLDAEIKVCGWVRSRRDHGGVIFLDLRDHTGLVQVVCEPSQKEAFASGDRLRPEHVVQAQGKVRLRPGDTKNADLPTGEVEILATHIEHLNESVTPPFHPDDTNVTEDTQLEHRVMHLRSQEMQRNLRMRHQMARAVRKVLDEDDFIDVETPTLTKATPEGARDFLVPSRNSPGHFYALPQSPQLFKQVLIAGGIDRYYQFARCFRDEDLRAGRQPEFTQIDIEMAFVTEADVMETGTKVARAAFSAAGCSLPDDIPNISYAEALRDYGTDAPDLSIDMLLVDVTKQVTGCGFKVFAEPAATAGNRVAALRVPGGGELTRKQIDDLTDFVRKFGAGGLAYLKVNDPGQGIEGVNSPIAKFLGDELVNAIVAKCEAAANDIVFFGAGPIHVVNGYLAPLRVRLGHDLKLAKKGFWPVWVTGFPLFERDHETKEIKSLHHPFTAPVKEEESQLLAGENLLEIGSQAYDLVINGIEIGGGSLRIHNPKVQLAALAALGIDADTARDKFGFLLDTLSQGAPPHGGIAFGFDRLVAMSLGLESIRSVIAFPKTQSGQCLFTSAPQSVGAMQLADLGLALRQSGSKKDPA